LRKETLSPMTAVKDEAFLMRCTCSTDKATVHRDYVVCGVVSMLSFFETQLF
jgi:hypothetical protein